MKFRTEVQPKPFRIKFGYGSRLLAIGSCFADYMAQALAEAKFNVTANPAGVLFNPASIARTLRIFDAGTQVTPQQLTSAGGRFFDYRFHGSLADSDPRQAAEKINRAVNIGHEALKKCDTVIITLGTAWVYVLEADGEIVANCHKQPATLFTRRRLSIDEIVEDMASLFETLLKGRHVILTVSPVRHAGDGAEENFLSKAILKCAAAELAERFPDVDYFPAYEIMNDDLRDYRFYAEDMVHPSPQAVEYIREKFFAAALDNLSAEALPRVAKIVAAAAHRPLDPDSAEFRAFARTSLAALGRLQSEIEGLDLEAERRYFESFAE